MLQDYFPHAPTIEASARKTITTVCPFISRSGHWERDFVPAKRILARSRFMQRCLQKDHLDGVRVSSGQTLSECHEVQLPQLSAFHSPPTAWHPKKFKAILKMSPPYVCVLTPGANLSYSEDSNGVLVPEARLHSDKCS